MTVSMTNGSYTTVKAEAQALADSTGCDYGVLQHKDGGYFYFPLPNKANRYGANARCEVVPCSVSSKRRQGHGYSTFFTKNYSRLA